MAEAAKALGLYSEQALRERFKKKYPNGGWIGANGDKYKDPKFGSPRSTWVLKTEKRTREERQARAVRASLGFQDRLDWMWKRITALNPTLIGVLTSFREMVGGVFHVIPPDPVASLPACVFIAIY